jgi:hypothetical protein
MGYDPLGTPESFTVFRLEERNRIAQNLITQYSNRHAGMDVALGVVSLIPGAAIPALITAIGLQAPVIYQPLARRLAAVYLASPDELNQAQDDEVADGTIETAMVDIVNEFGLDFIKEIAMELVVELGLGAAAATFIPFLGAVVAAGLDYKIATMMTERVGRMVSIKFQNGGVWVGSKRETYETAKGMTGDLDSVRQMPSVRRTMLKNLRLIVDMMKETMDPEQIRRALRNKGVPGDLIDEALA